MWGAPAASGVCTSGRVGVPRAEGTSAVRALPPPRLTAATRAAAARLVGGLELSTRRVGLGGTVTLSGLSTGPFALGIAGLSVRAAQRAADSDASRGPRITETPTFVLRPWLTQAPVGGDALAAALGPALRDHLVAYRYDSQVFAEQLIDEVRAARERDPAARVEDVLVAHLPQALGATRASGGSHCVGLAQAIAEELRGRGLPAVIGATELPGAGGVKYGHAFAFVPFRSPDDAADRGVLVLDPGLNLAEPIVVRHHQPFVLELGAQRWTFTLPRGGRHIEVVRAVGGTDERSRWHLAGWQNVDASLTKVAATADKLKLVARDEAGEIVAATVMDLRSRELTVRVGDVRARVPFDDRARIREVIGDELAELLRFPDRHALLARVEKVLDHEAELARARAYAQERSGR